jgi:hypothetical protein
MDSIAKPMINPNRFYTYAYLREDKTPYYIGKGQGERIYSACRRVKPPKNKSRIIFLKQNLTEKEAFKHEIYMIFLYGRKDLSTGILRNRTDGGEGLSGVIVSDETRKKLSDAKKGAKNPSHGKTPSEETRRKISDANKSRVFSEETRRKLSEANKGKVFSEETRRKLSDAHKGKTASEETRRKISEARKGVKHPNYGKKWWNDGCGNVKLTRDCPGDGWKLGMNCI